MNTDPHAEPSPAGERRAPTPGATVVLRRYMRLPRFCDHYDIGRTTAYRLFAAGKIRAIKSGGATLVDVQSAENYFNSRQSLQVGA